MDEMIVVPGENPTEGSSVEWPDEERRRSSEPREGSGGELAQALLEALEARGRAMLERIDEALPEAEVDGELLDEVFSFLEAHGISVCGDEEEVDEARPGPEPADSSRSTQAIFLDDIEADDTIGLYFREMVCEPLLSREEEIELAKEMELGSFAVQRLALAELSGEERRELREQVDAAEEARARFIQANTQLVVSIAKKYRNQGVPFLDLIQEGNLGLIKAVEKFDYRRGNRFSTYASLWIRQSVSRALPAQGRTIRVPMQMMNRMRQLYKASQRMGQELGRWPTPEEVAREMDLEPREVRFIIGASRQPVSLQEPVGEEVDSELGDFVMDELVDAPPEAMRRESLTDQVAQALETLSPREARILCLRFGLQGHRSYTLKEVGERFGLTRERIRQIQNQALQRLRNSSQAGLLRDYV
jgi:RNA polymerase primary sigma factor